MSAALSELHLWFPAQRERPKSIRHAVDKFLEVLDVERDARDDILTAIGEALINAVEHGYGGGARGSLVELFARFAEDDLLYVDVADTGRFIERPSREGRGFGLRVIEAIALRLSIEADNGTRVRMVFSAPRLETQPLSA